MSQWSLDRDLVRYGFFLSLRAIVPLILLLSLRALISQGLLLFLIGLVPQGLFLSLRTFLGLFGGQRLFIFPLNH